MGWFTTGWFRDGWWGTGAAGITGSVGATLTQLVAASLGEVAINGDIDADLAALIASLVGNTSAEAVRYHVLGYHRR